MNRILEIVKPVAERALELADAVAKAAVECGKALWDKGTKKVAACVDGQPAKKAQPVITTVLILSCAVALLSAVCVLLSKRR